MCERTQKHSGGGTAVLDKPEPKGPRLSAGSGSSDTSLAALTGPPVDRPVVKGHAGSTDRGRIEGDRRIPSTPTAPVHDDADVIQGEFTAEDVHQGAGLPALPPMETAAPQPATAPVVPQVRQPQATRPPKRPARPVTPTSAEKPKITTPLPAAPTDKGSPPQEAARPVVPPRPAAPVPAPVARIEKKPIDLVLRSVQAAEKGWKDLDSQARLAAQQLAVRELSVALGMPDPGLLEGEKKMKQTWMIKERMPRHLNNLLPEFVRSATPVSHNPKHKGKGGGQRK